MMKVDFHCHTKATKKGDGKKRNVTVEKFVSKVKQADIQAVAITNHNHFDKTQYLELAASLSDDVMIWPGVELDINGINDHHWHMIVIVSPQKVNEFSDVVDDLVDGKRPDDCIWDFEDVWHRFDTWDALFVSHCHDKYPAISEANIEHVRKTSGNDWRIFFEPKSLVTLGIWSNHGLGMLIGSDVKDWDGYENCHFSDLRLQVDSFEQLCLLAKRDRQIVETLLSQKAVTTMIAKPHSSVSITLPIRQDINVIFGQKGTGKTEIVKSLCAEYERLGIAFSSYIGGEKYAEYEKLLAKDGIKRSADELGRTEGLDEIVAIENWEERLPTPISEYMDWFGTKGNSEKKDRFKLADQEQLDPISLDGYETDRSAKSIVDAFIKAYEEKSLSNYLDGQQGEELLGLLEMLASNIWESEIDHYVDSVSTEMANTALSCIKAIIDSKSNTKSKPNTAGFTGFFEQRIELLRNVQAIAKQIETGERSSSEYLGQLEDKGKLYVVTRMRYLCQASKTDEFAIGITKLKSWKTALMAIASAIADSNLPEVVAEFCRANQETGLNGLSDFIGIKKYVVLEGSQNEYTPSDGEKGILVIERKLRDDASVYLLDEPELGMSNFYIDTVIRPIVQNLAKAGKTVIISTHNANLAVRTLPYVSVYREHVEGEVFRTYIGNPFTDKLIDIEESANEKNWSTTSMLTLEGGPDAFYDRKNIYEAGAYGR